MSAPSSTPTEAAAPRPTYRDGTPWDAADEHLASVDPTMRGLIERFGPVDLRPPAASEDRMSALILGIVSQQLSTRAAQAIFDRMVGYFGGQVPTARMLLDTDPDQLRVAAGLSHAKARFLHSLAEHVESGALDLSGLARMSDDEAKQQLMAVNGIGEWTANVFLMFNLHRTDVLVANDLGVRKAVQAQYGLAQLPSAADVARRGDAWRPFRTRASHYLWRSLGTAPI
jgi:DNA-3-methyladenine glycosylase II